MPAVGFALGIDRVILKLLDIIDVRKLDNAVDVYIMAVSEEEKIQALSHLLVEVPEGVVRVALVIGEGRGRIF